MHRSSGSRSPSAASLTSATGRMLPVSTDWRTRLCPPAGKGQPGPPGAAGVIPGAAAIPAVGVIPGAAAIPGAGVIPGAGAIRAAASALSAAAAPGSALPRAATASRTDGACAVSPAMNGSTYRRGSGMPASSSV